MIASPVKLVKRAQDREALTLLPSWKRVTAQRDLILRAGGYQHLAG